MATYDTYLTAGLDGVLTLGLRTLSGIPATDIAALGDNTNVLGDVPSDAFGAPTGLLGGNVTHTYLGTVADTSGTAVGFIASSGPLSALIYNVFVPSGVNASALSLTVLPRNGSDEKTQWDLARAAPLDTAPPAVPTIGSVATTPAPRRARWPAARPPTTTPSPCPAPPRWAPPSASTTTAP